MLVKIGFKNFFIMLFTSLGETEEKKKAGSFLHKFRYDMTKFGKGNGENGGFTSTSKEQPLRLRTSSVCKEIKQR